MVPVVTDIYNPDEGITKFIGDSNEYSGLPPILPLIIAFLPILNYLEKFNFTLSNFVNSIISIYI